MICVYSHTVTQYAGYKVVSKRNSNHATPKKESHTECKTVDNCIKVSFFWRLSLRLGDLVLDRMRNWDADWETMFPLWAPYRDCINAAIQSSETRSLWRVVLWVVAKSCTSWSVVYPVYPIIFRVSTIQWSKVVQEFFPPYHWIRGPTLKKKAADPILGWFNLLQLCELHPYGSKPLESYPVQFLGFTPIHSLKLWKIIGCDPIRIPWPPKQAFFWFNQHFLRSRSPSQPPDFRPCCSWRKTKSWPMSPKARRKGRPFYQLFWGMAPWKPF